VLLAELRGLDQHRGDRPARDRAVRRFGAIRVGDADYAEPDGHAHPGSTWQQSFIESITQRLPSEVPFPTGLAEERERHCYPLTAKSDLVVSQDVNATTAAKPTYRVRILPE